MPQARDNETRRPQADLPVRIPADDLADARLL